MQIIWTHVDLGSNTHISNVPSSLSNITLTTSGLGQVSGSKAPIDGIGNWPIILGTHKVTLPETLVMPNNPTSTLGGHALKKKSDFTTVRHEMNDYFCIGRENKTFTFSVKDGILRVHSFIYHRYVDLDHIYPSHVRLLGIQLPLQHKENVLRLTLLNGIYLL